MSIPINDGGPAFPVQSIYSEDHGTNSRGMTLRDYFAAQALGAYLAGRNHDERSSVTDTVAQKCYKYADAMLAAREAKP